MIQLCHQIVHYDLGRTYYKMSISEKIKAINNKIEQSKGRYDLDRKTAKISALPSGNVGKYELLTGKDVLSEKDLLENAATIKRFEYSPLGKAFEKQTNVIKKHTEVINKKEDKRNKLLKTIIRTDEKYPDKMRNAFLYSPKEQVEKYVEIDKRMKPEDVVYGKRNFDRYGTIKSLIFNFLTEVTDTDEMYKMLNEFNNEINELKSDYLTGQDEETDDVIGNVLLVYNNLLNSFDDYIHKDKQRTLSKRISKPGLSSSPLSTRFPSQETIAE